jgi:hypothetical protein
MVIVVKDVMAVAENNQNWCRESEDEVFRSSVMPRETTGV